MNSRIFRPNEGVEFIRKTMRKRNNTGNIRPRFSPPFTIAFRIFLSSEMLRSARTHDELQMELRECGEIILAFPSRFLFLELFMTFCFLRQLFRRPSFSVTFRYRKSDKRAQGISLCAYLADSESSYEV